MTTEPLKSRQEVIDAIIAGDKSKNLNIEIWWWFLSNGGNNREAMEPDYYEAQLSQGVPDFCGRMEDAELIVFSAKCGVSQIENTVTKTLDGGYRLKSVFVSDGGVHNLRTVYCNNLFSIRGLITRNFLICALTVIERCDSKEFGVTHD